MLIPSEEKAHRPLLWIISGVLCIVSIFLLLAIFQDPKLQGDIETWAGLFVFSVAAVCTLLNNFRKHREWQRFGPVNFHLDDYPKVGGELTGTLIFPRKMGPGVKIEATLDCKQMTMDPETEGEAYKYTHHTSGIARIIDQFITESGTNDQIVAKIKMYVPIKGKPTDKPDSILLCKPGHSYYYWMLKVQWDQGDGKYSRSFPIAVK